MPGMGNCSTGLCHVRRMGRLGILRMVGGMESGAGEGRRRLIHAVFFSVDVECIEQHGSEYSLWTSSLLLLRMEPSVSDIRIHCSYS